MRSDPVRRDIPSGSPAHRRHTPLAELLDDPAFLTHVATQAGVSARYVRKAVLEAAARGHLDLTITGPCTCATCVAENARRPIEGATP